MRAILDRAFASPSAEARAPRRAAVDGAGAVYDVPIGTGGGFDVVLLQEDIRQGQRVEQFTLEVCSAGACREFARGTTVGYKRLLRFPEVQVDASAGDARVRLTVTQARATPAVLALAVYSMGPMPLPAAPGVSR